MLDMDETTKYRISEGTYDRPGVVVEKDGVNFGCISGNGIPTLLLYRRGSDHPECEIPFPQKRLPGGLYSLKVRLPKPSEYEYNYQINETVITDPYAPEIAGREQFGQPGTASPHTIRGRIPGRKYDWKDDALPELPYEDIVMYQLHVRGFTMQKNSGVRHRGTYRGLREKIPYLKELGINQLRLMPAYEFDEIIRQLPTGSTAQMTDSFRQLTAQQIAADQARLKEHPSEAGNRKTQKPLPEASELVPDQSFRVNYWGYGSGYYFAPKASYASIPERASEEFKDLICTCHSEKIEVIMEFYFGDEADFGMISACLDYWAKEYHIDGFAVMARDSILTELVRMPLFTDRKLIGTWFSEDVLNHRKNTEHRMLAESNDGFMNDCRRLLKGDENCLGSFSGRIRRNPKSHAVINYMTHHDGFTMLDLVSYDRKHNEANGQKGADGTDYNFSWNCGQEGTVRKKAILELRQRQMKNAYAMMLLSQGTPMLLSGDEFANSQNGNNNPYCHDNELSWVDWSKKRREQYLTDFVRKLISFRQKHRILHMKCELYGSDMLSCGYPDLSFHSSKAWYGAFEPTNRHIGCMYAEQYAEASGFLYIAYNMHWESHEFALPLLPKNTCWCQVIDTSKKESFIAGDEQTVYENEKYFTVPPRTVMVLETKERDIRPAKKSRRTADMGEDKGTL